MIQAKAPEGAQVFDLEATRIARAEARALEGKGNPFLKLSVGYIEVNAEFALNVAFAFQDKDIRGGLASLLVDPEDVDALLNSGLTAQDLEEITKFVSGLSLGE